MVILVSKYLMSTSSKQTSDPNMKTDLASWAWAHPDGKTSREQSGNWIERKSGTAVSFQTKSLEANKRK